LEKRKRRVSLGTSELKGNRDIQDDDDGLEVKAEHSRNLLNGKLQTAVADKEDRPPLDFRFFSGEKSAERCPTSVANRPPKDLLRSGGQSRKSWKGEKDEEIAPERR
jgi:hypothetical protein